mgnify:CR=1 FL=1
MENDKCYLCGSDSIAEFDDGSHDYECGRNSRDDDMVTFDCHARQIVSKDVEIVNLKTQLESETKRANDNAREYELLAARNHRAIMAFVEEIGIRYKHEAAAHAAAKGEKS